MSNAPASSENSARHWPAPSVQSPIFATVVVPGSKSMTNRALILAALAQGPSTLTGVLRSRDTNLMIAGLQALGTTITEGSTPDVLHITPADITHPEDVSAFIVCGLAGTVMRFLPIAALTTGITTTFFADEQASSRPMDATFSALKDLGASLEQENPDASFPFKLIPPAIPSTDTQSLSSEHLPEITIDASQSSQFLSALLLAGAKLPQGILIRHKGNKIPSQPHIDMTLDMLRQAGVTVDVTENSWALRPQTIQAINWEIEPDLSNATPFLAAAAVTGGSVSIPHWPEHTTQAGDHFRKIITAMGAQVEYSPDSKILTVTGPQGSLKGITIDLGDAGELTPTVTALAALASSPSTISGIEHLRGHETDRLEALATEINALGGQVTQGSGSLTITPGSLQVSSQRPWQSYADHRMATAGAILGLRIPGLSVENIATTDKTLPGFENLWASMITPDQKDPQ